MTELQDWLTHPITTSALAIVLTLLSYLVALALYRAAGRSPLLNPVLVGIVLVASALMATDTDYQRYFDGAAVLHFLLGTATVALAVPLYAQLRRIKRNAGLILIAVTAGSLVAAGSAVGIALLLGASEETLVSLAPKSVTTPVAMAITERLGGLPALAAVVVIITGIIGAIAGPGFLLLIGVRRTLATGLAIGTAAHGVGTARLLQINREAGAWSGLAMGLNALITAILVPLLIGFML